MRQENSLIAELQLMVNRLPDVRGKGFHYPKQLKVLAAELLDSGTTPKELGELTGINSSTLSDWKTKRKSLSKFKQIKVTPARSHEFSIKTASGHQVFGLSVEDLRHLLKSGVL